MVPSTSEAMPETTNSPIVRPNALRYSSKFEITASIGGLLSAGRRRASRPAGVRSGRSWFRW